MEPRLALQLVHEAAFCLTGQRQKRTLSQQGFEVANGLPFVASDWAIHDLLDAHSVAQAQAVQIMLGKLRAALGHFPAQVLGIDPHRIPSYSKRQMVRRQKDRHAAATKQLQTFFVLDADSQQPIALTLGSSSRTVAQATPELLLMAEQILRPADRRVLVLCDSEHYVLDLLAEVPRRLPFDLLVPMPLRKETMAELNALPNEAFTRHWIGYATHCRDYLPKTADPAQPPYWQIIQRKGERGGDYELNAFLCTAQHSALEEPVQQYPKRWHCEEFFNANQALGWNRAGTHNLNIRYGQMTMALIAQAVIAMLRERLGQPFAGWNAQHLPRTFSAGSKGTFACITIPSWLLITTPAKPKRHLPGTTPTCPKSSPPRASTQESPGSTTTSSTSASNNRAAPDPRPTSNKSDLQNRCRAGLRGILLTFHFLLPCLRADTIGFRRAIVYIPAVLEDS